MATIDLPPDLLSIFKPDSFSLERHRWNTNEEIASILISFDKHKECLPKEVQIKPKSGSMLLYFRKKVRYRRDGYCWKKRKDGKTTREDHMKLKVRGIECIYGCYVHSAILSTFHRRCYWLLQNSDIVLVHYLNVPYSDDNKIITPIINISDDKKKWTEEELLDELKPMFFSKNSPEFNTDLKLSNFKSVEELVQTMMTQHRVQIRAWEEANDVNVNTRAIKVTAATLCVKEKELCLKSKFDSKQLDIKKSVMSDLPFLQQQAFASSTINATGSCLNVTQTTSSNSNIQYLQFTNASNFNLKPSSTCETKINEEVSTPVILNLSQFQNSDGFLILNNSSTPIQNETSESTPLAVIYNRNQFSESSSTLKLPSNYSKKSIIPSSSFDFKQNQKFPQIQLLPLVQSSHCFSALPISSKVDAINVELEKNTNLVKKKSDNPTIFPKPMTPLSSSASNQPLYSNLKLEEIKTNKLTNQTLKEKELNQNNSNYKLTRYSFLISKNQSNLNDSESSELYPMESLDNEILTSEEDLLNLGTFDILTDFLTSDDVNANLNRLTSNHQTNENLSNEQSVLINSTSSTSAISTTLQMQKSEFPLVICDFSPDWCYTEGGTKILLIGSWYSLESKYSVLFDDQSVPAILIQSGVLRCISPPHKIGCVHLRVICENSNVSNSIIFEYKNHSSNNSLQNNDYFAIDDNILKFCLLERLEILETYLSVNFRHSNSKADVNRNVSSFENKLISHVKEMMSFSWLPFDDSLTSQSIRKGSSLIDMSILHLVAALGYHTFAECLFKWKLENPSILLDMEIDAFSCDKNECTPLMWASARGHKETACLLYRWHRAAINLCNNQGFSALHIARQKKYLDIVEEIEKIEMETDENDFSSFDFKFRFNNQYRPFTFLKNEMSLPKSISCISSVKKTFSSDLYGTDHSNNLSLDDDSLLDESCTPSSEEIDDSFNFLKLLDGFSNQLNNNSSTNFKTKINSVETSTNDTSRVLTFAEHIIAAIPDRIKTASEASFFDSFEIEKIKNVIENQSVEVDDFIDCDLVSICDEKRDAIILDNQYSNKSNCLEPFESIYCFDENNYRHSELISPTPSPTSSCLQSPASSQNLESPSPPPSTEDLCEFFQASNRIMEKGFSYLTLSDQEQRELYEAAKVIQKAYRTYKGRKRKEQEKEKQAATIIQNYYRRYKQYKQMTKAAQIIQAQFRNYCENKRFKKSNQNNHVTAKDASSLNGSIDSDRKKSITRETMSSNFKRSYSQRRQHQAARKIQQFLRQSKNNIWDYTMNKNLASERTGFANRKREQN